MTVENKRICTLSEQLMVDLPTQPFRYNPLERVATGRLARLTHQMRPLGEVLAHLQDPDHRQLTDILAFIIEKSRLPHERPLSPSRLEDIESVAEWFRCDRVDALRMMAPHLFGGLMLEDVPPLALAAVLENPMDYNLPPSLERKIRTRLEELEKENISF